MNQHILPYYSVIANLLSQSQEVTLSLQSLTIQSIPISQKQVQELLMPNISTQNL